MPFYLGRKAIRRVPGAVIKAAPLPNPVLIEGFGRRDAVGALCREAGYRSVLVVTDQTLCGLGLHEKIIASLEAEGIPYTLFHEIDSEPTVRIVDAGLFEIVDFKQNMKKMSHGQKKKVLIAFALATNCGIIFMDEPSNGLDIPSKSIFRKVMTSAADEHRQIIISTHQVRDLHSLIDTILILDQGEILLNAPVDRITEKLLFEVVDTEEEAQNALYKEDTLRGIYIVSENSAHRESKMDIELLFNAALSNRAKIKEIFSL